MSSMLRRPHSAWAGRTVLACMLFAGLSGFDDGPGRGARRGLTRSEQRALSAGELVVRPLRKMRGPRELIGGSSWQVIDAPPAVVFRALLDTERYPRMLPQVSEAREVTRRSAMRRTVFVQHGAGPVDVSYHVNLRAVPDRRELHFSLDRSRPHGLAAAFGFYSVRRYHGGRSLLAYGVMVDLGPGLVRALVRDTVHEWMLKTPWTIKRFVEGSGRYLYASKGLPSGVTAARASRERNSSNRPTPDSEL